MTIITCDFETFWSQDYSLTKLSTVEYVLSPMFEIILMGIKIGGGPVRVCKGEAEAAALLHGVDWGSAALLSHNTLFDGSILSWRFGVVPGFYLDTLAMSRGTVHAYTGSSSLAAVARYFELAPKGDYVKQAKGRWLASFTKQELDEYSSYCEHDTQLCWLIYNKLIRDFPRSELQLIDLSIRKFLEPQAKLNSTKLALHLAKVRADKETALSQLSDIPKSVFASNPQFASLLMREGIKVPMKISPTTGEETWALAKNDPEFKQLCENPDLSARTQTMLSLRLNVKSTLEETRSETLLRLSSRSWNGAGERWMPVPYNYYGAHTGRFSGSGGFNFTNLKRKSELRASIEIPDDGYRIVHRDSSQIEARMVAWLANCKRLVYAFASGEDVYSWFAGHFYGRDINKNNPLERFVGKTCILGLGYGMSAARFKQTLYIGQGGISVNIADDEAQRLVDLYRSIFREIPRLWRRAGIMLGNMVGIGVELVDRIGPVCRGDNEIILPNHMRLRYPGLCQNGQELLFGSEKQGFRKIYGAKLVENITQALARIIVTDIELRVYYDTGYRPFMSTYDSHDYMVPVGEVEVFDKYLESEFSKVPAWASGLPLASEGGWGKTLLAAEEQRND